MAPTEVNGTTEIVKYNKKRVYLISLMSRLESRQM